MNLALFLLVYGKPSKLMKVYPMKLHLVLSTAVTALSVAGIATAQDQNWGDGAAYEGGRFITVADNTAAPTPVSLKMEAPTNAPAAVPAPVSVPVQKKFTSECVARITIPAKFRTDRRDVVVQDAHKQLSFSEPKFQSDVTRVKVRDEYMRYKIRQPRWEVETEEIVTRPEYERLTVVPAQWKYIDQTVEVSQPKLVWKRGEHAGSDITRTDPVTGTVYTLVEEAGQARTYRKRVMATPEQVVARKVPAKMLTVTKRVLTDPGGVEKHTVPAEFREYDVQRLVQSALPQERMLPAQHDVVETQVMVSPERWEWAPVLCGEQLTASAVNQLQSKLKLAGAYDGAIDGAMGPQTREAVRTFQASHNLPHGGELTLATLEKLGLANLTE